MLTHNDTELCHHESVVIARQRAVHAERDIVLATMSVCLSICASNSVLCLNECTYRHTFLTIW